MAAPHLEEGAAERGSSRTRQPRKAEWGPWEATQGVELSTWKCLDGERLQRWCFFLALPGQGRPLMQRLDSIRVAQNLAACRLHFAHGHVSFSLCKIFSEILGPIFASQVISHKNYLQNKEGLEAERLYPPEARVLADRSYRASLAWVVCARFPLSQLATCTTYAPCSCTHLSL